MTETIEIVISAILLFLVFAGLYQKFLKGRLKLPAYLVLAQVKTKTKIFGAGGLTAKKAIVLVIILAALWPFFGPADKTYGAEEFKKLGCNVDGDSLVLNGNECQLTGTEKMSIAKVVIIPESLPTGGKVSVEIGSYKFGYSSYHTKKSGYDGDFYKGEAYRREGQKWTPITYVPEEPGKSTDNSFPIVVWTNRWYSVPILGFIMDILSFKGDSKLQTGSQFLAYGALRDEDPPAKGLVVIKATGTGIKEVKIYYGSLLRTILGAIGMS